MGWGIHEGGDIVDKFRRISRRLLMAFGGLAASGALVLGGPAGVASAAPGDPGDNEPNPSCFGIPECTIPGFGSLAPSGRGGGGYLNGKGGGGFLRGEAGGGFLRGIAGGGWSRFG